MRRVLIDLTRLLDRTLQGRLPTGVDRVSLEYIRYFGDDAQALVRFAGRWLFFGHTDSRVLFAFVLGTSGVKAARIRVCVARACILNWRPPPAGTVLFNTGHSGLEHPGYARQVNRFGLRPLFFLHDLIPVSHPEYCRMGEAERHRRRLTTMLSVCSGLIVNSRATGAALEAYAQATGQSVPPWEVAFLAPAGLPVPAFESPLNVPYFVILGTIEARKNHLLLLHVWRQLVETQGDQAPGLVVIGQQGWECEQVLDLLERCEVLQGRVIQLPKCSDQALATWLYHARALLFPSFAEGFGMPLVEALALGVPVIASDLSAFREVAGDIPEYLDPLDGPGWKACILAYAGQESGLRRMQCERMTGYQVPSWRAHFECVERLMQRSLN